jgi:hypothetical protein
MGFLNTLYFLPRNRMGQSASVEELCVYRTDVVSACVHTCVHACAHLHRHAECVTPERTPAEAVPRGVLSAVQGHDRGDFRARRARRGAFFCNVHHAHVRTYMTFACVHAHDVLVRRRRCTATLRSSLFCSGSQPCTRLCTRTTGGWASLRSRRDATRTCT